MVGHDTNQTHLVYDVAQVLGYLRSVLQREPRLGPLVFVLSCFGCVMTKIFSRKKISPEMCELRPSALLVGGPADVAEDLFHIACSRQHLRDLDIAAKRTLQPRQLLNVNEMSRLRCYISKWNQLQEGRRCEYEELVCV